MSSIHDSHQELIDQLVQKAKQRCAKEFLSAFQAFISLYYLQVEARELAHFSHDDLYNMAWSHWQLIQHRKSRTVKLRVFNPTEEHDGFSLAATVVQLSIDDMPFLVDSMRMAIVGIGYDIDLMIHTGGLVVERDRKLRVKSVCEHLDVDATALTEAPVAFYINRLEQQAELDQLRECLERVISDIILAVDDWEPMRSAMLLSKQELQASVNSSEVGGAIVEAADFLQWVLDEHFTFLGSIECCVVEAEGDKVVECLHNSGLGIFHEYAPMEAIAYGDMTDKARILAASKECIVVVCKSDIRSTVHRDTDMDLIVVKQFDKSGNHIAERQFYGLFTSTAFATAPQFIPMLRLKVSAVLACLNLPSTSYAGKDLKHILITLPRDALFELAVDELAELAQGILQLQDRRKVRLFCYRSLLGKIFSCLVYLPRDNFNMELLYKIQAKLESSFEATDSTFNTEFGDTALVCTHYNLHVGAKQTIAVDIQQIEEQLGKMSRSWQDDLHAALTAKYPVELRNRLWKLYAYAFPAGYREDFSVQAAALDMAQLEKLDQEHRLGMSFYDREYTNGLVRLKFFHKHDTVPLSDTLPLFENMGLRVIGEHPYELMLKDDSVYWINDFHLQYAFSEETDIQQFGELLKDTIKAVWYEHAENDALNRLVLSAQLDWRKVSIFRAYARYMRQAGFTYSQKYIEDTLNNYPSIVKMLFHYFDLRFNPDRVADSAVLEKYEADIITALDVVVSLDEDKILRRYVELMKATLRINFYQDAYQQGIINYLAIKFASSQILGLPKPLPEFEIYVYAPRFEAIHLRASKVARGGLRWSDRREDFRTEVLGLMKAQRVKNAVIVPQGAKGGFVVKSTVEATDREAILNEGIACYQQFIQALLELTDNIVQAAIVPPEKVICYDDPDPYLVVAADKGTATFSDIANKISTDKQFWLGDAFASGGSAGYDHKKMGITARGAWVACEEHFQNLDIDLSHQSIRVVGIGDMSGDVFGNGMLLSEQIALVAAFNHLHIFIDPNPSLRRSYRERRRLFEMPRSGWDDYDRGLISTGGGVYKRSAKLISLSEQVRELLGIEDPELTPDQLIQAILASQVDLLWNGGVGTFVKASCESHADVGDRNNDALRIDAAQLRCKVIGEGGNLGLTQLARIEFSMLGGLVNSDFIDNSAGVDCSDQEVNIKILLQSVLADHKLEMKERDALLLSMTDEVGQLVLAHNKQQCRAITINTSLAIHYFNLYQRYMQSLEQDGRIDMAVEYLPTEQELTERLASGVGMTRPEIATLFAYSKIDTKQRLLSGNLLQDPYFDCYLTDAFPSTLLDKYTEYARGHRLRSEIVATQLTNHVVAEMGLSFVYQMYDETNAECCDVVRAYVIAANVFSHHELMQQVEELNYLIPVATQRSMYITFTSLIRRSTRWLLRQRPVYHNIPTTIDYFQRSIQRLFQRLPKLLLGAPRDDLELEQQQLIDEGVIPELAQQVASAKAMYHAWNIVVLAAEQNVDLFRVAKIYFTLVERLDLFWFREQIDAYPSDTRWSILAKASYKGDLDHIQRDITRAVIELDVKAKSIPGRIDAWMQQHGAVIERWTAVIAALRGMEVKDYAILSIAIRNLKELAEID